LGAEETIGVPKEESKALAEKKLGKKAWNLYSNPKLLTEETGTGKLLKNRWFHENVCQNANKKMKDRKRRNILRELGQGPQKDGKTWKSESNLVWHTITDAKIDGD